MQENKEELISLLTEMKIRIHFEKKDRLITLKLTDIINLFIKLLKLLGNEEDKNEKTNKQ